MPLGVFRNGIEIPSPSIIKNPNVDQSQRQFVRETVFSLAVTGNAYWRVYGNPVASLEVLDPNSVTVQVDPDTGVKTYWLGANQVRNIKHLTLMKRPGQAKGNGPIQSCGKELAAVVRLRQYADNWFNGSGTPTGYLSTDQTLNADEAKAYRDAFGAFMKDGGTPVLGKNFEYKHLGIKPADAQYLEIQQAHTVNIARLFGVPATLLATSNEGGSMTYSNQQDLFMQFLQTTLISYMNEIEDALSSLLPRGQEVNFKEEALLRMNTKLEVEVAKAQIDAGLITADEWREAHGLPPLEAQPNTGNEGESNGTDA